MPQSDAGAPRPALVALAALLLVTSATGVAGGVGASAPSPPPTNPAVAPPDASTNAGGDSPDETVITSHSPTAEAGRRARERTPPADGRLSLAATADAPVPAASATPAEGDRDANRSVIGRVRLLTGQTVTVVALAGTRVYRVSGSVPMRRVSADGDTYVFPASVSFDRFSPQLFNVDLLLAQNVTADGRATLPLMVRFDSGTVTVGNGSGLDRARRLGVDADRRLGSSNTVAGTVSFEELSSVAARLRHSGAVERVYYDPRVRVALDRASRQVGAGTARRRYNVTGEGTVIAVLDTGINETHPDLDAGKELLERNFVRGENTTRDVFGHGTAVAAIAAGTGEASDGTHVGVAPGASLLDVRVLGRDGFGTVSGIVDGLEFAVARDADVVTMSLGASQASLRYQDPLARAVEAATAGGTTVVVAAGNGGPALGTVTTPGIARSAITVAATDAGNDGLAAFSARGPTDGFFVKPDIAAPGVGLTTADGDGTGYVRVSGTSMATPMVSGAAALLLARNESLRPAGVKARLVGTADPIEGVPVYAQGGGRLNVTDALGRELVVLPGAFDFGLYTANTTASREVFVRNTGSADRTVALAADAVAAEGEDRGVVSLARTALAVPAGEQVAVTMTVDAAVEPGIYGGLLTVAANGSSEDHDPLSVPLGYARGRQVAVQKQSLSGPEQDTVGDRLLFDPVGSALGTARLAEYAGGTTTFVTLTERVRIVSVGTDERDGSPVVVAGTVNTSRTTVVDLSERDTVVHEIDTSALAEGGLSPVVLETTVEVGTTDPTTVAAVGNGTRRARLPVGTPARATVELLAVPSARAGEGPALDVPVAYLLEYDTVNVTGPRTYTPDPGDIGRIDVTYHRTRDGQRYAALPVSVTPREEPEFVVPLGVGSRTSQQLRVNTETGNRYAVGALGEGWTLVPLRELPVSAGESTATTVNEGPLFGTGLAWEFDPDGLSFRTSVYSDQSGAAYRSRDGRVLVSLRVGSDPPAEFAFNGTANPIGTVSPLPVAPGQTVTLRTVGVNRNQPLSTRVETVQEATYDPGDDSRPPTLVRANFTSLRPNNSVPAGTNELLVVVRDESPVELSVRVGGNLTTGPGTNATVTRLEGSTEQVFRVRVSTDAARPLDVAIEAVDANGNRLSVRTTDAVRVTGGGPPALADGLGEPTDPDGDGVFEDVNGNGGLDIGDIQALFVHYGAGNPRLFANEAFFDFNGNGGLDVGDVQALFVSLSA